MSASITVRNPYDGTEIGEVPSHTAEDVQSAVEKAKAARYEDELPAWRRAEILDTCSDMIGSRREELAHVISKESAKPIAAARVEVARALSTMGFSSIECRKIAGEVIPMEGSMVAEGKIAYTTRVPVGVVGAISPFNFPLNLVCHKIGPAIAAGCPVVLKPASQTPFSSLALAEMLYQSGLPESWLSVVTGSGSEVGKALVESDVDYISFTGSSEVGWGIQQQAPKKRVALELGNSTPLIVTPDSDWEDAAYGVATAGYTHAGQSCVSVQRVYVHSAIAEPFTDLVVQLVSDLVVGDPEDERVAVSALIDENSRDRVAAWIQEAVDQGAKLLCGGTIEGSILTPAVLSDTTLDMKVCKDEVFGPVVSIATFETFEEALDLANGTRYGLQAGIFTNDLNTALRASRELEFAGVIVNEVPTWRADIMPYGGIKDSGNTREGPAFAVQEMTEPRLAVFNL